MKGKQLEPDYKRMWEALRKNFEYYVREGDPKTKDFGLWANTQLMLVECDELKWICEDKENDDDY